MRYWKAHLIMLLARVLNVRADVHHSCFALAK